MVKYQKDLVAAKVKKYFPTEDQDKILSDLSAFSADGSRVELAILKLSEGDLGKLYFYIEESNKNWRNVIALAEYPEEMANDTWKIDGAELFEIRRRDRQQYIDWLYS